MILNEKIFLLYIYIFLLVKNIKSKCLNEKQNNYSLYKRYTNPIYINYKNYDYNFYCLNDNKNICTVLENQLKNVVESLPNIIGKYIYNLLWG